MFVGYKTWWGIIENNVHCLNHAFFNHDIPIPTKLISSQCHNSSNNNLAYK
jgi:hypothetical protein